MENEPLQQLGIQELEDYKIPTGLPVDPSVWQKAVEKLRPDRQMITNDLFSAKISKEEASVRLELLRKKLQETYLDLLRDNS